MAKSTRKFERWVPNDKSTWSFQVFQKYNAELVSIWDSHIAATRFTYSQLKKEGAEWTDLPSKHFNLKHIDWRKYPDLKVWSESYNLFDNWVNLSAVVTLASNLESYLASAIAMSIDSDPGLLLGASRSIDGAIVLKRRRI